MATLAPNETHWLLLTEKLSGLLIQTIATHVAIPAIINIINESQCAVPRKLVYPFLFPK